MGPFCGFVGKVMQMQFSWASEGDVNIEHILLDGKKVVSISEYMASPVTSKMWVVGGLLRFISAWRASE